MPETTVFNVASGGLLPVELLGEPSQFVLSAGGATVAATQAGQSGFSNYVTGFDLELAGGSQLVPFTLSVGAQNASTPVPLTYWIGGATVSLLPLVFDPPLKGPASQAVSFGVGSVSGVGTWNAVLRGFLAP